MDAKILATLILIISYVILFSEAVNRAVIAMLGAGIMVITGILTQQTALEGIDFNTIFLLIGMMIIVCIGEKSGMFEYVAIKSVQLVKANPRGLMIVMAVITALFSALLDNVTTVLLIVPITFQITQKLKISAFPYLLLEIFSSNIGGTATLIGDPPNILIGSALNLSFMDFVKELAPIVTVEMLILIATFDFIWHKRLIALPQNQQEVMQITAREAIKDKPLLIKSLIVLSGVIVAFITAEHLEIENGTIALFGAAVLLLLYTLEQPHNQREKSIAEAFNLVDWTTIFFFAGLFIIVQGLEETGILQSAGQKFLDFIKGDIHRATMMIIGLSAFLSSLIDNIPFVATMIPLLKSMEEALGGRQAVMPLWWALSLGSCLGGNGTLIAASANVIVAGIASREGEPLKFMTFLKWSIPVMIFSIIIATIYLDIKYF